MVRIERPATAIGEEELARLGSRIARPYRVGVSGGARAPSREADHHAIALSRITAIVLLLVFALSVPASARRNAADGESAGAPAEPAEVAASPESSAPRWPLALAVCLLGSTGVLAAHVSDLFVGALQPTMISLHINQVFAGLVIVAIAGNAVENVVGIQLAWQQKSDHALSAVILNSPSSGSMPNSASPAWSICAKRSPPLRPRTR